MEEQINMSSKPEAEQYKLPSALSLLEWAFSFYRSKLLLILGIMVVPFILQIFELIYIGDVIMSLEEGGVPLKFMILRIISGILGITAYFALLSVVVQGEDSVQKAYVKGLRMIISGILLSILMGLTIIGGIFLFIVPGIILAVLTSLGMYVLFSENKYGARALAASWQYVRGYWLDVLWRHIVYFMVIILPIFIVLAVLNHNTLNFNQSDILMGPETSLGFAVVYLVINSFIVGPLFIIYGFGIYNSLRKIKGTDLDLINEKKLSKRITWLAFLGIFGPIILIILFIVFLGNILNLLI